MPKVVRWLSRTALVSTLMFPVSVAGQTVQPADLVGTWLETQWQFTKPDSYARAESPYVEEMIWTFRPDSTWVVQMRQDGIEDTTRVSRRYGSPGRWELRGDTLRIANSKKTLVRWGRVASTGEQLVVATPVNQGDECMDTLKRVDASKPLPPPATTPPPSTVSPAALAGTWVRSYKNANAQSTVGSDTLTLGADNTARSGKWELLPGDHLGITRPDSPKSTSLMVLNVATVQGQAVISWKGCFSAPSQTYKRVSP